MKPRISLWIHCCIFTNPLLQFLVRGTFTEQRCLFDKCSFLRTQYCGNKRIKTVVFFWIAGGVYWSAVSFTNPLVTITGPRCRLLICDAVYKSPRKKNKMLKTDQKKVPSQKYVFACSSRYNDLTFYEKKNSHFTIPLMAG